MINIGSRAQVMHGTAKKTSGGLHKSDLKMVGDRIVSRKRSAFAKKQMKTSVFGLFAESSKKQKCFKLAPRKGTKAYMNIIGHA